MKLKKIIRSKIEKPKGRWCLEKAAYGRLPFPIECSTFEPFNQSHPHCRNCNRRIEYDAWKRGEYIEIKKNIEAGKDYTKKKKRLKKIKKKIK